MGLADFFDVVVSAADPGVNRFKPCPDGIFYALRQLGVDPDAALYVGDRPEVDGEAARSAGVAGVIIGRGRSSGLSFIETYTALSKRVFGEL